MTLVTLYGKPECHLCDDARAVIVALRTEHELDFELEEVDITRDEGLHRAYFDRIPVVAVDDDEQFQYFVDPGRLRALLRGGSQAGR